MLSLYMHKSYIISHTCALNFPHGCLYFVPINGFESYSSYVRQCPTRHTNSSVSASLLSSCPFPCFVSGTKKRQQLQHKFGGRQEGRYIQLFWKVDEGVNILASHNNYDCLTHLNTPLEADRCILMTDGCLCVCVYTECKLVCVCEKREWEQKRTRESSMSHL